jgi:hypothetical protein
MISIILPGMNLTSRKTIMVVKMTVTGIHSSLLIAYAPIFTIPLLTVDPPSQETANCLVIIYTKTTAKLCIESGKQ